MARITSKMDIKMLQKSSTFSSLSGVVGVPVSKPKNKPGSNLGSWFDRRAKKLSMKCSRSITLGECCVWRRNRAQEIAYYAFFRTSIVITS